MSVAYSVWVWGVGVSVWYECSVECVDMGCGCEVWV